MKLRFDILSKSLGSSHKPEGLVCHSNTSGENCIVVSSLYPALQSLTDDDNGHLKGMVTYIHVTLPSMFCRMVWI